jgi:hypothetical protein
LVNEMHGLWVLDADSTADGTSAKNTPVLAVI